MTVKPEEDARRPILEAQIQTQWQQARPAYYRNLHRSGRLQIEMQQTALECVRTLHSYQNAGLSPNQGREAVQDFVVPQPEWQQRKATKVLAGCPRLPLLSGAFARLRSSRLHF